MHREDRLLQGAFDVHAHGYPEFTTQLPPRLDNVAWARAAAQAGMRGFIVKSHIWPTTATAAMLTTLEPELEIYGGIACNPPVGGLSPLSVEIAAQTGAKIVWMPTWSARQESGRRSIYRDRMESYLTTLTPDAPYAADLSVFAADGSLSDDVRSVLQLCRSYDMVLATGHLPIEASLALAEECEGRGVRLLLTHPLSGSVGATIDQQRAVVAHGGMIEHVFVGCMPMHQRMHPAQIADAVAAVGAEHCVLGSDAIEAWNPPAPELMRMFIATLLALGVSETDVWTMTHENPARLFNLDAPSPTEVAGVHPDRSPGATA